MVQQFRNLGIMKNIFFCLFVGLFALSACGQNKFKDLEAPAFKEATANKSGIVILDVRTPAEWKEGVLEGAVLLNFYSDAFKEELTKIDPDKKVYIYCRSGGRSAKAAQILSENGYSEVYNLLGGIGAWNEAKYKTVAP